MQAQQFEGEIELMFLDGGSEDGTPTLLAERAAEDPRIRVVDNPERLIPQALNLGLGLARGEFVARMDSHTLYPPDYLATGVERLRRGDVDWVSGPQLPFGVGTWSRRIQLALESSLGVGGAAFRRLPESEIDSDAGFTGMWRRATLVAHGGWDVEYPFNEDGELGARIRQAGGRIVVIPSMAARYIPRNSLRGLARQYWRYGQDRAKTCRRHPESMRRSHLLPPGLVLTFAASALGSRPVSRMARVGVWAYLCAITGESARKGGSGQWRDAALLPAVFATMHLTWGTGFLVGSARFGPPWRAIVGTLARARP